MTAKTPTHKGVGHAALPLANDAPDASLALVRLDQIVNLPRVDELRMDKAELQQLAEDIVSNGVEQEVVVRIVGPDLFEIVDGRHRAAAHVHAGFGTVPAKIRRDLDDQAAAVRTIKANQLRKDLLPFDEARDWNAALDAGLTQMQLSAEIGVSQPVISKRLKLLQVPEAIARLAGVTVKIEDVAQFAPLMGHEDLAKRVAATLANHELGHGIYLQSVLDDALCKAKPVACLPLDNSYSGMVRRSIQDWSLAGRVASNKKLREELAALDHIQFPKGPMLCLDVRGAKDAIEHTKQRLIEADKANGQGAKATKTTKSPKEVRAEKIKRTEHKLQLDFMAQHIVKQETFGEELVKHAYRHFLQSVGQVASRKVEQEALAAILGEYAPRGDRHGNPIANGRPELVDKLWDKDRIVLDRYIAAVVHLHAGGYDHHVTDDQVLKFTTGKTGKQVLAAAEAAVDAQKKPAAKPKAKKAAKAVAAKNGAKKAASAKPKAKAKASPVATLVEKTTGTRPGAAVGKECPECKTIVKREGRGKGARLVCICTPVEGVPIEVVA